MNHHSSLHRGKLSIIAMYYTLCTLFRWQSTADSNTSLCYVAQQTIYRNGFV